ncbi:hypothetical protein GGQ64_005408 [Rhizobium azooxidifex]|uniref:Uncharacterized protein n=1 Tax=Mycoplana azooxidifex TaxID=1636188 RepID=A0A7W6DF69_9HYPH|nr:hypothetical protein [Mycoplana azooxidifex]MBB3980156.1 hypothetical protein [Mycoplana azooxidifex]
MLHIAQGMTDRGKRAPADNRRSIRQGFLKRSSDWNAGQNDRLAGQTLSAHDEANAPVAKNGYRLALALKGDQLHFQPSVKAVGNADEIADLIEGMVANFGYRDAVASRFTNHSVNFQVPTDVVDAAHDALAKILVQIATGTGDLNSELFI